MLLEINKAVGRKAKVARPPAEELAALYKDHTMKEVGKHYGVSENVVRNWLYYYRCQEKAKLNKTIEGSDNNG